MKYQSGSSLIVVMLIVVIMSVLAALAYRSGFFALKMATNSQAIYIMDQNTDATFFQIEDSSRIAQYLVGTGLFGYPKMDGNQGKELVLCYKGSEPNFYEFSKSSVTSIDGSQVQNRDIGGSRQSGYCQVTANKEYFVSGRAAAMTQVSVRIMGFDDTEAFSHYQEGTDPETGKLDEAVRLIVTSTTLMPVLSTTDTDDINACMKNPSYKDPNNTSILTISECLESLSVPYRTQMSEYSLGQFIHKVKLPAVSAGG